MVEKEDHECAICFQIMGEPSKLPCNHIFCLRCLEILFSTNTNNKCPICRTPIPEEQECKIDIETLQIIEESITGEAMETVRERVRKERELDSRKLKIHLEYGNTHRTLSTEELSSAPAYSQNEHQWKVFLRSVTPNLDYSMYIDKVVFTLHPTFFQPVREVVVPPYEVEGLGWGVFNIPIQIFWKGGLGVAETVYEHYLSFQGNGNAERVVVSLDVGA